MTGASLGRPVAAGPVGRWRTRWRATATPSSRSSRCPSLRKFAEQLTPERTVGQGRPHRPGQCEKACPTLGLLEITAFARDFDQLPRQRHGLLDATLERIAAVLANVRVGVVLGGQEQEAHRARVGGMWQRRLERSAGGAPAGGVAIEAEDDRVGESEQLLHMLARACRARAWRPRWESRVGPAPRRPCSPRPPARSRAAATPALPRTGRTARGPC